MSDFVEECRDEWKRLQVPEPLANEMAADLTADLKEAEADGTSAEYLLGNELFDPRGFAERWARERGVLRASSAENEWGSWYKPGARAATRQPALMNRKIGVVLAAGIVAVAIAAIAVALLVAGSSKPAAPVAPAVIYVPDLLGQRQDDAATNLRSIGLAMRIRTVRKEGRGGVVVREVPPPGSEVGPGTVVSLQVSR